VVRALDVKLLRGLWQMKGQAFAIALVLAAATATFVLSTSVHASVTQTRDSYYARNHFADVFAEMTRAPRSIVDRVAAIPGVQRAQGSIQQYATLDFPDRAAPVRALIHSVPAGVGMQLNRITLRAGRLPSPAQPDEVVVDEAFAEANELRPGDRLTALIYGTRQQITVVGIGLAPNFIYALAPGDLVPDNRRFGVFWMGEEALEAATDREEAINSLAVTLQRGASEQDVIRAIDGLLEPYGGAGAYGREDHPSHAFLANELVQLEAMTRIFPPVFLLVSTFLVYIVLGRMIGTERTQIGLLKAFGYSDAAVGWHYLKFALAIAVFAAALGSLAGIWMGRGMTALYAEYYRFPFLQYGVSPAVFAAAALLAVAAAALGALGGMRRAVRLSPATAMAPPPPPVYRAGSVERVGRAAGLTAIGHMIVRHIARWPTRSAVTVFGVSLSLSLLFSTLQFRDAAETLIDSFFLRAQQEDLTVTFVEPRNKAVLHELAQIPGVHRVEGTRAIPVRLSHANRVERTALEATDPAATLSARIDSNGEEIALPPAGLMLSRRLADQLGVNTGDKVFVEMLGGRRTQGMQPVASIVDEFIGARAYASEAMLNSIARDAAPFGSALLAIDTAQRQAILRRLKEMPVVLGVTERDASLAKFQSMIDENLFTMLFFYVTFASAIAVGVVYNSARILFAERAHELATLRVLGYHRSEVAAVLLGELALLVVAAVPLGCLLGNWMGRLMTGMLSSDLFRLPFSPQPATYGYATLIVLAAALGTAVLVALRVRNLDMVAVLKARD
jgi:putative ABC transport system permease protein